MGFVTGISSSNLINSNGFLNDGLYIAGADVLISFQNDFSKRISLEWDLEYVYQGNWIFEEDILPSGQSFFTDYKTSLSYFRVPVLFKMNFGRKLLLSPFAGPYVAMLFSAKYIRTELLGSEYEVSIVNISQLFNKLDFGLTSGVSLLIPLNNVELSLDLRNNLGLRSNLDFGNAKNISYSALFGLKYNFGNGWD